MKLRSLVRCYCAAILMSATGVLPKCSAADGQFKVIIKVKQSASLRPADAKFTQVYVVVRCPGKKPLWWQHKMVMSLLESDLINKHGKRTPMDTMRAGGVYDARSGCYTFAFKSAEWPQRANGQTLESTMLLAEVVPPHLGPKRLSPHYEAIGVKTVVRKSDA